MFAKALRGLRRLAIRFDAWMTEKPKHVSPDDQKKNRDKVRDFLSYQRLDAAGGLRPAGKSKLHFFD